MSEYCRLSSVLHARDCGASGMMYMFFCPGCGGTGSTADERMYGIHVFYSRDWNGHKDSGWTFDGNAEKPTFAPSLECTDNRGVCHLVLEKGIIKYQNDCFHELKSKEVPMVPYPDEGE